MSSLTPRNIDILRIIVEEYIKTGDLVGSKSLLKKYDLGVSSATVRNDMAKLENFELIFQPYNSAGRYPTPKGLRVFVNYMMNQKPDYFIAPKELNSESSDIGGIESATHKIVYDLSNTTKEISFICLPEKGLLRYSGIPDFLEKNYKTLGEDSYNIIRMLEEKRSFIQFVEGLNVMKSVSVFVGEEKISSYLKDYTIIVRPIEIAGYKGFIGLIGSLRMDYSFNISAIRGIL